MSSEGATIADVDLEDLIKGRENEQKEFKSGVVLREPDGKHRYEIAKQLVAFANRGGGHLIFGINDSGEIEDGKLDEELSIGTISQVARMRCSPPIDFAHQYYSQSRGDKVNGDVFVVGIEPRRSIPHAIIEQSEGEIRKREYRIRSGDESRLITDGELNWLFNNRFDELGKKYSCRSWFLLDEEGEPITPPMKDAVMSRTEFQSNPELPIGSRYLANFVRQGPDFTDDGGAKFPLMLPSFLIDVMPFAILLSINNHFSESWLIEWDQEWNPITRSKEIPQEMTDTIGVDDIEIRGEGRTLSHFDFDPIGALCEFLDENTEFSLSVPMGTSIVIELDDPFPEIPAVGISEANLTLTKGDVFEFTIQSSLGMAAGEYPKGHPEDYRGTRNAGMEDISSTQIHITFTTDHGVPEIQDPYLEEHRKYAENIERILENEWNADKYLKSRREELIFEIDGKIDRLMEILDESNEE